MVRLVLLSDVSEEFPKNTSSSFTVRLPEPLQLDEGEGEVGLLSLAMLDARLRLDDLTDTFSVSDGVVLMRAIVGLLEWGQTVKVQLSNVDLLDTHCPVFHWEARRQNDDGPPLNDDGVVDDALNLVENTICRKPWVRPTSNFIIRGISTWTQVRT